MPDKYYNCKTHLLIKCGLLHVFDIQNGYEVCGCSSNCWEIPDNHELIHYISLYTQTNRFSMTSNSSNLWLDHKVYV